MIDPRHVPLPSRVFARRIARIAFGAVLLAGWPAMVLTLRARGYSVAEPLAPPRPDLRSVIGWTWLAAAVAGAIGYALAAGLRLSLRRRALFRASLVLPVAAIALMLPLTLHGLVALATGVRARAFDEWVVWSLGFSGIAHLLFAALCVARVRRLADGRRAMTPERIFCITVAVSCVPFALLYLIPPVLVAITGLPILPLLQGMESVVDRERAEFAGLPRAVVCRSGGPPPPRRAEARGIPRACTRK